MTRGPIRVQLLTCLAVGVAAIIVIRGIADKASPASVPASRDSVVVAMTTTVLPIVPASAPAAQLPEMSDRIKLVAMGTFLCGVAAAVKRAA